MTSIKDLPLTIASTTDSQRSVEEAAGNKYPKLPFEKFVITTKSVNTFLVSVASPEMCREEKCIEEMVLGSSALANRRYLFIEDAIREKLERD